MFASRISGVHILEAVLVVKALARRVRPLDFCEHVETIGGPPNIA
jgi:hypothetical protein